MSFVLLFWSEILLCSYSVLALVGWFRSHLLIDEGRSDSRIA